MKHLLASAFLIASPFSTAYAAPTGDTGADSSTTAIQECQRAGEKMLSHQLGKIGDLILTGTSSRHPRVSTAKNQTFVDGIGTVGSQHGTHEFAFRCARNHGSGKTEFTYNNMQFHSPLGAAVVDPLSAAGAAAAK